MATRRTGCCACTTSSERPPNRPDLRSTSAPKRPRRHQGDALAAGRSGRGCSLSPPKSARVHWLAEPIPLAGRLAFSAS